MNHDDDNRITIHAVAARTQACSTLKRTGRFAGAALALIIALASTAAGAQPIGPATAAANVEVGVNVPLPPVIPGCYQYQNGWGHVPCASAAYVRAHYPPTTYSLGTLATPKTSGPKKGKTPSLVYGDVSMIFDSVGSIHDSRFGPDAFSIQDNTNFFTGLNGHTDWVQFTDQSHPGQPDGLCIWNVDVSTATYDPTCLAAIKARPGGFFAGDRPRIQAFTPVPGILVAVYTLPWLAAPIEAVVAFDEYGLARRWSENSGWVMGMGDGSQLSFSDAELWTRIGSSDCGGDTARNFDVRECPGEPLEFFPSATVRDAGVTAEGNNLLPVTGIPPLHVPPRTWANRDLLWMDFVATTSGKCPAHTSGPVCLRT